MSGFLFRFRNRIEVVTSFLSFSGTMLESTAITGAVLSDKFQGRRSKNYDPGCLRLSNPHR